MVIQFPVLNQLVNFFKGTKTKEFEEDIKRVRKYTRGEYTSGYSTLMEAGDTEVIAKYDSTSDSVSSQTANNFSRGIIPKGVESVEVKIKLDLPEAVLSQLPLQDMQQSVNTLEQAATLELQKTLNDCGFRETILSCSRDYIDYGNTIAVVFYNDHDDIKCENVRFSDVYFWSKSLIKTESMLCEVMYPEVYIQSLYPEYRVQKQKGVISFVEKTLNVLYLDKFLHKEFLNSLSLEDYQKMQLTFKPSSGDWYKLVIDGNQLIGYEGFKFCPFYISKVDNCAGNGYGKGDGLNTMGAILRANISAGGEMISQLKIQSPNMLRASQCVLRPADPALADHEDFIDPRPGRITVVSDSGGSNSPLASPIQGLVTPASDPGAQLQYYTASHENAKVEVKEGYQTAAYVQGEPIPSEPIPAVIARLAQSIRSFKGKSDAFREELLLPMIETIFNESYDMKKLENAFLSTFKQYEGLANLKLTDFIEVEIEVKSTLNEMENDLEKTNFEREMAVTGGLMQLANPEEEGGGELFQTMMARKNEIYK